MGNLKSDEAANFKYMLNDKLENLNHSAKNGSPMKGKQLNQTDLDSLSKDRI
jgi:hypothetical protein